MESVLLLVNSAPSSPYSVRAFQSALALRSQGHPVSMFLLQDAVLAGLAINGANAPAAHALDAGVSVYALAEDLAMRGFTPPTLRDGVRAADYAQLVELFERHTRVIGAL